MSYNPATERAQLIETLAAQNRAVIEKLPPAPKPTGAVWDCTLGGWKQPT